MDDRFTFKHLIGKGPTGGVYKAVCKTTGTICTVRRFYPPEGEFKEGWKEEFLEIMQRLSTTQNPHITPIYEASIDEDGAYLISEYNPSLNLSQAYPAGMSMKTFMIFAKDGLSALNSLHAVGIVHGRLGYDSFIISKLANENTKFVLKEFGLRRIASMLQGIDPFELLPSNPVFLAPEHFSTGIVQSQTDLYMFGQLCYLMLAGCHPLAGNTLEDTAAMHAMHNYATVSEIDPDIPQEFSDWVDSLTHPEIDKRPQNAIEAVCQLESIPNLAALIRQGPGVHDRPLNMPSR